MPITGYRFLGTRHPSDTPRIVDPLAQRVAHVPTSRWRTSGIGTAPAGLATQRWTYARDGCRRLEDDAPRQRVPDGPAIIARLLQPYRRRGAALLRSIAGFPPGVFITCSGLATWRHPAATARPGPRRCVQARSNCSPPLPVQRGEVLVLQPDPRRRDVLLQVPDLGGAGDRQHHRAAPHHQVIWLLAQRRSCAETAALTGFARRWVEQLLARDNAFGPASLGNRRGATAPSRGS